jgi:hypothetical protein
MAEHTKLPWHNSRKSVYVSDTNHNCIAQMIRDQEENEANAAHIVKACNAFPDLVKALEEAALQLEYMQERMPTGTSAAVLARINHLLVGVKSPGEPNG